MADRVVVMNAGRIEQIGTPDEVYAAPASPFVYDFLGSVNLFHGRVSNGRVRIGGLDLPAPEHAQADDVAAVGYARPHDLEITSQGNGQDVIDVVVRRVLTVGPRVRLELDRRDADGGPLEVELTREEYRDLGLTAGQTAFVRPRTLRVYPRS